MRGTQKPKKRITKVEAFKTSGGCVWETETEALDDEINGILSTFSRETYEDHNKFAKWLVDNEKDILWIIKVVKNGGKE